MIKIDVKLTGDLIENVHISGHAGYDKSGKDIVCAAVSSIVITTVNAIIRLNESIDYIQNDDLKISVKSHDKITDILMENMLTLLEELEKTYKKYIKINREVS